MEIVDGRWQAGGQGARSRIAGQRGLGSWCGPSLLGRADQEMFGRDHGDAGQEDRQVARVGDVPVEARRIACTAWVNVCFTSDSVTTVMSRLLRSL